MWWNVNAYSITLGNWKYMWVFFFGSKNAECECFCCRLRDHWTNTFWEEICSFSQTLCIIYDGWCDLSQMCLNWRKLDKMLTFCTWLSGVRYTCRPDVTKSAQKIFGSTWYRTFPKSNMLVKFAIVCFFFCRFLRQILKQAIINTCSEVYAIDTCKHIELMKLN